MKQVISNKRILVPLLILAVIFFSASFFLRALLIDLPFAATREMDGPSGVFSGPSGRVYIIDEGKKRVLVLGADHELEFQIDRSDRGFYYASLVAEGDDGSIYIADTLYSDEGTILEAERIFRYDAKGKNPKLVYEIDYRESENPPMQYGEISSLRVSDNTMTFALRNQGDVEIHARDLKTGEGTSVKYFTQELSLSDVSYIPETRMPVVVTRLGEILLLHEDGGMEFILGPGTEQIPWRIFASNTKLMYTDLAANRLMGYDLLTGETAVLLQGEEILYTAFETEGRVYTTDYIGFYCYEETGETYVDELALHSPVLRSVAWLCLFAGILLTLVLLVLFLLPRLGQMRSATFQRMIIVIVVSLSVAGLVSYLILSEMVKTQNDSIMEQLGLYGDVLVEATDVEALQRITEITDYQGEEYQQVKTPLDMLTQMTYENGLYYYYSIYVTDGALIYGVMDFEDTMTTRHPFYAFGEEGYTDVFFNETVEWSADVSSYGSWSFVLKPVLDQEGNAVAIMEVGANLDDLQAQTRALVWQIVLTVAATTVVLVMLIIEAIFFIEYLEQRSGLVTARNIGHFPIRTLVFLAFFADCMQDAFVSIYANQLYTPLFGIPQGIGAALPLSAQVLAAALAALAGGGIIRSLGIKRVLVSGFVAQIAGFLVCALVPTYLGLLLGKVIIGVGMGQIIVSMNTLAASAVDESTRTSAFAAVSAGTLAGVTAGVGIGSVVLSFGGFDTVYLVGAVILTIGVFIALGTKGYQESFTKETKEKSVSIWRFLADKQVISFLVLVLMPFLIALSYREYFFPIYAAEMGITEADIGRIFLACGLVVIYAGPYLTERIIRRLGGKWAVALASLLISAAVLLFVLVPTLVAAIAGIVLLSLATSFGYAVQSDYFASRKGVANYGESRAMGVYSLFDNGGQTLGPVIFAAAMLAGYQMGLLIVGICLVLLLVLFLLVNGREKRGPAEAKEADAGKEAEVC